MGKVSDNFRLFEAEIIRNENVPLNMIKVKEADFREAKVASTNVSYQ